MGLFTNLMSRIPKCSLYTETFWSHATPQDVVKALRSGINVNIGKKQYEGNTQYGDYYVKYLLPPFALACRYSLDPEIIRILICQANADPNGSYITGNGYTNAYFSKFIDDALSNPNPGILQVLLENGLNLHSHEYILFAIRLHPIKYKMLLEHNPILTSFREYDENSESILTSAKRELSEINGKINSSPNFKFFEEDRQHIEQNIQLLYDYKADTVDLFLSDEYWKKANLEDVKKRVSTVINEYTEEHTLYRFLNCLCSSCPSNKIITYMIDYYKNKNLLNDNWKDSKTFSSKSKHSRKTARKSHD